MQSGDNIQEPRPGKKKKKEEDTPEQDTAQSHGEVWPAHEHITKFTPREAEDRDDRTPPDKIGP